jgi:flagellar protein FlaJ
MNYEKAFHSIDMEPASYVKKFAIPVIVFGFVFSFILYAVLPTLFVGPTQYIPALLPVICILFAVYYPMSIAAGKAAEIDHNMHYYITQMGAIATAETPRLDIIRIVSYNKDYLRLADETKKIYDLVTVWNMSLAEACKFISKRTPSILFEDFLDRFAHGLQSGENVNDFLSAEQNVVMNEYESMYEASLYAIEMIKELFVSMVMSLIFLASFAVIMPVITGMDAILLMAIVVVTFIATDLVMIVFAKSKVPKDPTWQQTGILTVAMIATPLVYTGRIAKNIEKGIRRRDENFPSFIRSLGSSAGARGGMVDEALKSLRAHDFGPLTRRLSTRIDKIESWHMFAASTGSNLIQRFSVMFVEATHLGGKPEVIGDIIATNFHRIVTLRKKRYQSASSLVGVLYGLTGGIGFTMYISLGVLDLMQLY